MKRAVFVLALMLAAAVDSSGQRAGGRDHWVGTWATALVGRPASVATGTPLQVSNQTLRQIVRTSIGGDRVRVVLSNTFGTAPLTVGAAHIGVRSKESAIVPASARALSFSGHATMTIPAGAVIVSDAAALTVPPAGDLAVDIYLPGDTATSGSPMTLHPAAFQTSYVSAPGNHSGVAELPVSATTTSWFLLSRVEVTTSDQAGAIVAVGDSITDGARSTVNTNSRWPDILARRLLAQPGAAKLAVVNAGIGGNRVLSDGTSWGSGPNVLARFDRDVLAVTGATHVIVLEGINDIGAARQNPSPGAGDLIAGHRQLIARAHARGLRIYGATLTPFEGAAYFTMDGEGKRQALNEWIRTSKEYDGVIDFDAAVRDPKQPSKFLPEYHAGDNLHPNDAGFQAMGNAIDLKLLTLAVNRP